MEPVFRPGLHRADIGAPFHKPCHREAVITYRILAPGFRSRCPHVIVGHIARQNTQVVEIGPLIASLEDESSALGKVCDMPDHILFSFCSLTLMVVDYFLRVDVKQ